LPIINIIPNKINFGGFQMENTKIKLRNKYIVNFEIRCKTGLHIGGTDTGAGIGEIDNPVLKDPSNGYPYISGSSLKGRMRERLEWLLGNIQKKAKEINDNRKKVEDDIKNESKEDLSLEDFKKLVKQKLRNQMLDIKQCDCGICEICHYFGHSNNDLENDEIILGPTRFIFRDAFPAETQIHQWEEKLGSGVYTEAKTENTISRLTAIANPRTMERVPADSVFSGEIVIDLYDTPDGAEVDDIKKAFELLLQGMVAIEQSFLGGTGSRGSGVVEFKNLNVEKVPASYYVNLEGTIQKFPFETFNNATKLWKNKIFEQIN